MALEDPGPGRCDVCGERVASRHAFLVRVKGARGPIDVAAAHCEACDRCFRPHRMRRLQAVAVVVLATLAFAPLSVLLAPFAGGAAPLFALVVVGALVALAVARAVAWHDSLRDALGPELLDDLVRGLPDVPGTLTWRSLRFFPSWPRDASARLALADVRARARRTRELPN